MSTYIDTRSANQAIFEKFIIELAEYFPDFILNQPNGPNWNTYFVSKNDPQKGFYISPDHYKGKIEVSTRYYRNHNSTKETQVYVNGAKLQSLNCGFSYTRDAESVANGIKKRFMPNFEAYYILVLDKWKNDDAYENGKEQTVNDICAVMGIKIPGNEQYNRYHLRSCDSHNKNIKDYISGIEVSSESYVNIEFRGITRAQALKVINAIKHME